MVNSVVVDQPAMLIEIASQLRACLHHLDLMGLTVAGACLDMTIGHVEKEISSQNFISISSLDVEFDFTFLDEMTSTLFQNED